MSPDIHDDVLDRWLSEKSTPRPPLNTEPAYYSQGTGSRATGSPLSRVSRNQHFAIGAGTDPQSMHPNVLNPEAGSVYPQIHPQHVGFVETKHLLGMRGNDVRNWGSVNKIREDIRSGKGIVDPLMVEHSVEDGNAYIGEGNHRLAAAALEGVTHVPTTVVRSKRPGRTPKNFPRFPGKPLPKNQDQFDEFYHPSKVFPEGKVWPDS